MVPQCKVQGEKKIARAKERGRRRARRGDMDEEDEVEGALRGGLHKLEILQVRPGRQLATFAIDMPDEELPAPGYHSLHTRT